MDVLLLCVKTLPKKSLSNISALILKVIQCNANLSLPEPQSLFLANHFVALSTESLVSVSALSLESHLLNLQPFKPLDVYQS